MRAVPLLLLLGCRPADVAPPAAQVEPEESVPVDSVVDSGTDTAPDTARRGDSGDTGTVDPLDRPLNVIVVLADDQVADSMWAMPVVSERLLPEAIRFTRAYATVPMCCPMRSSFLSGGWYPRDTGVLSNIAPMGGATRFSDTDTIATRLQQVGVATGLFGKYLNEYELGMAPYVAPGWDRWVALEQGDGGYNHEVVIGSSTADASSVGVYADTGGEHLTQFLFEEALDFVDAHAGERFFVFLTPMSPHEAGAPATEDEALYPDYAPRPASWNEADVSDKPAFVQGMPSIGDAEATRLDEQGRRMMQNLASLDRGMGTLLDGLAERGLLEDTVILYASDHGVLFGEHRLSGKGLPYEEAVHVPLLARVPGLEAREDARLVEVNTDLAATVLDLFGAAPTGEGISLHEALVDPTIETRDHVYIDNDSDGTPVWAGVITDRWKYVEWASGDTEIYDLDNDPYELENLYATRPHGVDRTIMGAWVDEHRTLAITTTSLPDGAVGRNYVEQLDEWGGTPPYTWSLGEGALPPGLTLASNGALRGTPESDGTYAFSVWVTDSSVSPATGRPQSFRASLSLTVGETEEHVEVVRTGATSARFSFRTRPGVSIFVRASPDKALEGLRRISPTVVADATGMAVVDLVGLDTERAWFWAASFDGVVNARGLVPEPE